MLFWYQTHHRVVTTEWGLKLSSLADGFFERRTDASFVRVFVRSDGASDGANAAASLARLAYPRFIRYLPE
jgi:Protein of unknown function (DUF3485)